MHLPLLPVLHEHQSLSSAHDILRHMWRDTARVVLRAVCEQFVGCCGSVEHHNVLRAQLQVKDFAVLSGPFVEL